MLNLHAKSVFLESNKITPQTLMEGNKTKTGEIEETYEKSQSKLQDITQALIETKEEEENSTK